jgi:hypothetical protein
MNYAFEIADGSMTSSDPRSGVGRLTMGEGT